MITYYTEDIYKIADLLEKEFRIDKENSIDKTKIENPDKFGYLSLHYVLSINNDRSKLSEWKSFKEFKIEVQIRTILQHSWAAIDHKLRYKTKGEIPSILQRKIFRLSALLELADEEFLSIKNETLKINEEIESSIEHGNLKIELNSHSLISYLADNTRVDDIIKIAEKIGFHESSLNQITESEELEIFVPRLINSLRLTHIKTIQDLDNILNQTDSIINKSFKEFKLEFDKHSNLGIYSIKSDVILILVMLSSKADIERFREDLNNIINWEPMTKALINLKKNRN